MFDGEAEHGPAHEIERERGWRHEFRAFRAIAQIFVGRGYALDRIAVEQSLRCQSLDDEGEFPGEIVAIIYSRIRAAHAENRDEMSRIAGEQHPLMTVILERERVRLIDADPNRVPRRRLAHHVEQAAHARYDILRLDGFIGVFTVPQLVVDSPDIVWLLVDQDGRAGIAGRIEIRQPFRRSMAVEQDVNDDVAALVARTLQLQAERFAQEAAAAVGSDDPVGLHDIVSLWSIDGQQRTIIARIDGG